ncbi:hypothetical protein LZQ00_01630 [Sphingobacterium sp. SRCM116780]|uniref:hypothetical protein n=1 Tax=Sphingobacterium sp. SRCM116780 TaxID=2907623 RepID=UPI001F242020|nr:hypothetical protein [Sphingobacterium sp. SRCM116780]UIR56534.1 hypothetical protein LZQ00_01630 [Sphingobacterium sp. SRCM116780]
MQDKLKEFVKANREGFDHREPSAALWEKIRPQVIPQKEKIKPSLHIWKWASAAAVFLMIGIGGYFWSQTVNTNQQVKMATKVQPTTVETREIKPTVKDATQVAQITISRYNLQGKKKKNLRETPANLFADKKSELNHYFALLQDTLSASKRLEAVLAFKNLPDLGNNEMNALEETVITDPNSNVRMAALDVVLSRVDKPKKQDKIEELFVKQDDPSLQVEMLQWLARGESGDVSESTKKKLNEILEDPFALKLVKDQAYAVLLNQ